MPWDFAVILAVLGILLPWRGARRVRELLRRPDLSSADRVQLYASTMLLQAAAAAVVLWRALARGLTPEQLGLSLPHHPSAFLVTAGLCVALATTQLVSFRRLARLPPERQGMAGVLSRKLLPQQRREFPVFAALAATVALCEEFVYRGFLLVVLDSLDAGRAAAAVGSSAFFALAHAYQGRRGMVTTFVVGLIFAAARLTTGSLLPPAIAHFTADLLAGLAGYRLLAAPESSRAPAANR